jgi:methyl-accepting chemotaxis protein
VVDAIGSIRATIEEIEGLSGEVSVAVDDQLAATRAIAGAVEDATHNSREVAESVGTMALTAAETGKSAIEMIYSAGRLAEEFKNPSCPVRLCESLWRPCVSPSGLGCGGV